MSIEKRLDLIGEVIEKSSNLGGNKLTSSFTNETNYILRLGINIKAFARTDDFNARDYDFHWKFISDIKVDGVEYEDEGNVHIGSSGGNNSQYDQRDWDYISDIRYVEVKPGQEVALTLEIQWVEDNDSGNGSENGYPQEIAFKALVVGALENQ